MARIFQTDINLLAFSLLNAKLHPVSADPSGLAAGDAGRVWFNTTTNKFMVWNGTAAIDATLRTNHTGTQTASTISDFTTAVQAIQWRTMAVPTAAVSLNNQLINNLLDPVSAQDAATKNYVDVQLAGTTTGQILKGAVRCAPTTNVSLTAPGATLDGVTLVSGDIVLLTGQTTGSQNGPYVWTGAAATLTRATNWNTSAKAVQGSYWVVEQGANADTFALMTNDTAITLDTTVTTFTFRGAAGATYTAGVNGGLTLSGSAFSVAPGTGIAVGATTAIDTTVVARKITGVVPTATAGIYTVSGAQVTVNHALANSAPALTVRYGSAGTTPGALVEVDSSASDANNLVITFPAAPVLNQYVISIVA